MGQAFLLPLIIYLLTSIDTEEAVECIEDIFDGQQLFLTVFDRQSESEPDDTADALEEENEEEKDAAHRSSFCMFLHALKSQKQHLRSEAFISLASAVDSFSVSIENQLAMLSSPSLCLRICSAALPSSILSSGTIKFQELISQSWFIVLCHGGYFAAAKFDQGKMGNVHKSLKRYVSRQKQGRRQLNQDKGSRSGHSSVGSQIRRSQEKRLDEEIRRYLLSWKEEIDLCQSIFVFSPGAFNRSSLFFPSSPLDLDDKRLRSVSLTTNRPTLKEVKRVMKQLATVEIITQYSLE